MLRIAFMTISALFVTVSAFACPDISGKYLKVPGSDQYFNVEYPGGIVKFPNESFTIVRDDTCTASLTTSSGKVYELSYVPSQQAYMNTQKIAWYVFKLSVEPYTDGSVYLRYSRTRSFFQGVAPTYTHTAVFAKTE